MLFKRDELRISGGGSVAKPQVAALYCYHVTSALVLCVRSLSCTVHIIIVT